MYGLALRKRQIPIQLSLYKTNINVPGREAANTKIVKVKSLKYPEISNEQYLIVNINSINVIANKFTIDEKFANFSL